MLLGIRIHQGEHNITLSQTHFIDGLLIKFGLENTNTVSTPLDPNVDLDYELDAGGNIIQGESYSRGTYGYATPIGTLVYLAIATRPDIAYAVNRLAPLTQDPQLKRWTAVKRLFSLFERHASLCTDVCTVEIQIFTHATSTYFRDADYVGI